MNRSVIPAALLIMAACLTARSQQANNDEVSLRSPAVTKTSVDKYGEPVPVIPRTIEGASEHRFEPEVRRANFGLRFRAPKPETPSFELDRTSLVPAAKPLPLDDDDDPADVPPSRAEGFNWSAAFGQSMLFLAVQHTYAITAQSKTRLALEGPFFKDYFNSVKALRGWDDGGRFFTNYIAHPMEGSFLGFVQVQNDPQGRSVPFSGSGKYWKSRAKAMAWSAAWSTQFEIGPISQASIGNVGLKGKQTYVDIVVTPTVGIGMLVAEDALDRYLIRRIEQWTNNQFIRIFSRMLLNPTRTMANVIRFEKPWYRDKGLR